MDGGSAYGIGNTMFVAGTATTTGFTQAVVKVEEIYDNVQKFIEENQVDDFNEVSEIDTDSVEEVNITKKDGSLKSGILLDKSYDNFNGKINIPLTNSNIDKKYGVFSIIGDFKLFTKVNEKSIRNYIYCNNNVTLSNNVFGKYILKKGEYYNFNLITVGRDPKLKRNNLFIAKRRIKSLIKKNILNNPIDHINKIAKNI